MLLLKICKKEHALRTYISGYLVKIEEKKKTNKKQYWSLNFAMHIPDVFVGRVILDKTLFPSLLKASCACCWLHS